MKSANKTFLRPYIIRIRYYSSFQSIWNQKSNPWNKKKKLFVKVLKKHARQTNLADPTVSSKNRNWFSQHIKLFSAKPRAILEEITSLSIHFIDFYLKDIRYLKSHRNEFFLVLHLSTRCFCPGRKRKTPISFWWIEYIKGENKLCVTHRL